MVGARGAAWAAAGTLAGAGAGAAEDTATMALAARARRAESTLQSIAHAVAQMEKATQTTQLKMERTEAAVRSMARRSKVQGKMVHLIGKRMNELEERLNMCAEGESFARRPSPVRRSVANAPSSDATPTPPALTPPTRLPRSQSCSATAAASGDGAQQPAPTVRRSHSVCQQPLANPTPLRRPETRTLSQNTIKRPFPPGLLHRSDIPPGTFSFSTSPDAAASSTAHPSKTPRSGITAVPRLPTPPVKLSRSEASWVPQNCSIRPPLFPTQQRSLSRPVSCLQPSTVSTGCRNSRHVRVADAPDAALLKFTGVPSPPSPVSRATVKRRSVACTAGTPGVALHACASTPAQPTANEPRKKSRGCSVASHFVAPSERAKGAPKAVSCVDAPPASPSLGRVSRSVSWMDTLGERAPARRVRPPAAAAAAAKAAPPPPGTDSASSVELRASPPSPLRAPPRAAATTSTNRVGQKVRKSPARSRSVSLATSASPPSSTRSPPPPSPPPPPAASPSHASSSSSSSPAAAVRSSSAKPLLSLAFPSSLCCLPLLRPPAAAALASARSRACCRKCLAALGRYLLALAHEGRIEDVRTLLDTGVDVNFPNTLKWTPLHKAAAKAHEVMVSLLLHRGANVHARTSYGFTALHLAAYNDRSGRCVALLVNAGADLHCLSRSGRTPLDYAHECRNSGAVRALVAAGASSTNSAVADDDDDDECAYE